MKKLLALLVLALLVTPSSMLLAKGGGGGGHSSGGSHSSSSSSRSYSSSRSTSSTRTSTAPRSSARVSKPSTSRISSKPSKATVKVKSAVSKKVNGKTFSKTGEVVDSTYQPRFRGGYVAPIGSTVYYESRSFIDYLPFYLIMTNQQHQNAVVSEPAKDGQPAKDTVIKQEGTDSMYVWNWVISLALVGGLIWLIVYWVNKKSY